MENMTFCVPCLFGLEGLVGDELKRLDLQNVRVEDRRVFFDGDFAAMSRPSHWRILFRRTARSRSRATA